MIDEGAVDEFWDELHPTSPHVVTTCGEVLASIDGLTFGKVVHLVLSRTPRHLHDAIVRIRLAIPMSARTWSGFASEVPCLIYGHDHWLALQDTLENLFKSGKQAFIGTMNTFVIDCFGFSSSKRVRDRILFAEDGGLLRRMTEEDAEDFYVAYRVGIEHTSEILRSKGLW